MTGQPPRGGVDERAKRSAEALRANLKRRKAQERGRAENVPGETAEPPAEQGETKAED